MSQNDTPEKPRDRLGLAFDSSFDPKREIATPREAATVLVLREAPEPGAPLEVYCVVRHKKSGFLGGAVVFPGGKIDETDGGAGWEGRASGVPARSDRVAASETAGRTLAIGAARETLEEAGVIPLRDPAPAADVGAMRAELEAGEPLYDVLSKRGATLDTAAFVLFARWTSYFSPFAVRP